MFAYCLNNPNTYVDLYGDRACIRDDALWGSSSQPSIIETILDAVIDEPTDPFTVTVGLTGNGTFNGLGGGVAGSISVDSTHTYALQTSQSAIVSMGSGLSGTVGLNFTYTNAKYVTDLDGKSLSGGITIVALCGISIDYVTFIPASNPNTTNHGISITIATGAGAGVQTAQAYTKSVGLWNPYRALKEKLFGG